MSKRRSQIEFLQEETWIKSDHYEPITKFHRVAFIIGIILLLIVWISSAYTIYLILYPIIYFKETLLGRKDS